MHKMYSYGVHTATLPCAKLFQGEIEIYAD